MERKKKVWLTGAAGQLGSALLHLSPTPAAFDWIATTRAEIDLSDMDTVRTFIRTHQPDIVVNAAAYTAVDKAEQEVGTARTLNTELPRVLAEELAKYGGSLVHISTDYVFGGDESRTTPYTETDETSPIGVYGQTKSDGEEALLLLAEQYYILRTSWLYGPSAWGHSFYRAIRERVLRSEKLAVVTDEVGAPTSTLTLSRIIIAVVEDNLSEAKKIPYGIYHVADLGETNRHHFAEVIAQMVAGIDLTITKTTHAERLSAARRPKYSTLDTERMRRWLPHLFRPWQEALMEVVRYDREQEEEEEKKEK